MPDRGQTNDDELLAEFLRDAGPYVLSVGAGPHPSSATLAEYCRDELDDETSRHLRVHLLHCDECFEVVHQLEQVFEREQEESLWEGFPNAIVRLGKRVSEAVVSAISGLELVSPVGAVPLAVRGPGLMNKSGEEGIVLRKRFDDLQLDILVRSGEGDNSEVWVRLTQDSVGLRGLQVKLEGAAWGSRITDDEGLAAFVNRPPGEYSVRVENTVGNTVAQVRIHIRPLDEAECVANGKACLLGGEYSRAIDFFSTAVDRNPRDVRSCELMFLACTLAALDPVGFQSDFRAKSATRGVAVPQIELAGAVRRIREAFEKDRVESWLVLLCEACLALQGKRYDEATRILARVRQFRSHELLMLYVALGSELNRVILDRLDGLTHGVQELGGGLQDLRVAVGGLREDIGQLERRLTELLRGLQEELAAIKDELGTMTEEDPTWAAKCDEIVAKIHELLQNRIATLVPAESLDEAEARIRGQLGESTWQAITDDSRHFLRTAEAVRAFLGQFPPINVDHAPACVEFCKALEKELEARVMRTEAGGGLDGALRADRSSSTIEIQKIWEEIEPDPRKLPYTASQVSRILRIIRPKRGNPAYSRSQVAQFLGSIHSCGALFRLGEALADVGRHRNGAAHDRPLTEERLESVRQLVIGAPDKGLVARLVAATRLAAQT